MTENISFIIILEFVAPFAVLSIILLIALLNGNKKNKKGLVQLLDGVQAGEKSYQERLLDFLKKAGIKEDELDDAVHKFTRSRRAFFKDTLNAMNANDPEQLEGLSGRFGVYSDLYHQLEITPEIEAVEGEEDEESSIEATYKVVKRENKRLKAEVHVSVSALNGLFKEYASMFGEVPENKSEMTVQEILESMKKFTKGDFKPEGVTNDMPPEMDIEEESADSEDDDISVSSEEPDWGDAFEESGDTPDEGAVEQFEESKKEEPKAEADSAEPDWGDAFEESGDTPDEGAVEQFEESKKEEPKAEADSAEPDWGDAFEESGDTPDETAVEQFEESKKEPPKK